MRPSHPVIAALLVALCALPALAQTGGGSSYSVFNIGDLRLGTTAAGLARGGTEATLWTPSGVNTANPALLGLLDNVTIQAGLLFSQNRISDASGSLAQNRTALEDFAVGFPISERWGVALAAGLHPYSTVGFSTRVTGRAPTVDVDSVTAEMTSSGRGGISEAFVGASFAPIPEVSIGLAGTHYFGSIDYETGVTFPGTALNRAIYLRADHYSGWGFRAGVAVQPVPALTVSGLVELPVDLERERLNISAYLQDGDQVVDTATTLTGTVAVPTRISVGAALHTGRFLLGAQGTFQSWETRTARSAMRIGIGLDRIGSQAAGASVIDRWNLRAGAFLDQTYYQVDGTGIDEYGVTLGLGIPLTVTTRLDVGTTLDLGLEIGQRGTTDAGLTEELFGRLLVQFSVSELWFVKARR